MPLLGAQVIFPRRYLTFLAIFSAAAALPAQELVATNALPDAPVPVLAMPAGYVMAGDRDQNLQQPQQPASPSLEDLGLSPDQTKADPDLQAKLNRRTHMLKVHQRLGLITVIPIAAACISSFAAPPDPRTGKNNEIGRDIHVSLGALSGALYTATAYYAIRAPKVTNEPAKGGIKWHKYLIYAHAPGMVLTPILGAMAFNQASNGEKVHGIASAHGGVAVVTALSYGAAITAVSWPLHLPGKGQP